MSTNYHLRNHIYKGHEVAHLDARDRFRRNWLSAFDEVPAKHPLRRAIDELHPLIHVCLTGSQHVCWAMIPDHVNALAGWYSTQRIFIDEYGDELTGKQFLDIIGEYERSSYVLSLGKVFC